MSLEGRAGAGYYDDVYYDDDDADDDGDDDDDDDDSDDESKVRPVIAENPWLKNDKKRLNR